MITFPASSVAVAYCCPRPIDTCATAAEQQVIVQLIFFRRRPPVNPLGGRAFDGQDDSAVIIRRKDVPSEAVVIRLPPDRSVLRTSGPCISPRNPDSEERRERTISHSSVRLYHPSVSGSIYALLVIFPRRSSVSRFETSGPGI